MSSTIVEIYAALDAMAVTYLDASGASVTATSYSLGESLDNVLTSHLPCRLLILPNTTLSLGPGPEETASYVIQDLFLLEAVSQGGGSAVHAPVLLRYIKAYQDAIEKKWQFLSTWQTEALTANVTITPGKYTYPSNSENVFYGVMVSITIEEIF